MKHNKLRPPGYPVQAEETQAHRDPAPELNDQTGAAIISENMTLSGDLCGTGTVLVNGTVIGRIMLNGPVTITRKGTVRGPIQADIVYVAGSVEGSITAKKSLRLEMTGSILGDVTASSFIIEDGGLFNGRSEMTKSGGEPVIIFPNTDTQETEL